MTSALIALALIALLALALERNHRRNAGTVQGLDREDRDADRIRSELMYREADMTDAQSHG